MPMQYDPGSLWLQTQEDLQPLPERSSIQKPKQPQWYLVAKPYLNIVRCHKTIRNFFDLIERFVFTAYLYRVSVLNQKIPL